MLDVGYFLGTFFALNGYYLAMGLIFYWHRNMDGIQKRLPAFVALCTINNVMVGNMYFLGLFHYTSISIYNFIYLWWYYLFIPAWLYCHILRDINVIFLHHLNEAKLREQQQKSDTEILSTIDRWIINVSKSIRRFLQKKTIPLVIANRKFSIAQSGIETPRSTTDQDSFPSSPNTVLPSMTNDTNLSRYASFQSRDLIKLMLVIYFLDCCMALVLNCILPNYRILPEPSIDQEKDDRAYLLMYGLIGIYFITKPIFLYSQRKINDNFGFRIESFLCFSMLLLMFVLYITDFPIVSGYERTMNIFIVTLWNQFVTLAFPVLYLKLQNWSLGRLGRSESKGRLGLDQDSFYLVLDSPDLFALLEKELAASFCIENGIFIKDFRKARSDISATSDPNRKISILNRLHQKFIASGSAFELNLPDTLKREIANAITSSSAKSAESGLEKVYDHVLQIVFENTFPRFIKNNEKDKTIMNRVRTPTSNTNSTIRSVSIH